jgi:hypothetical protein
MKVNNENGIFYAALRDAETKLAGNFQDNQRMSLINRPTIINYRSVEHRS